MHLLVISTYVVTYSLLRVSGVLFRVVLLCSPTLKWWILMLSFGVESIVLEVHVIVWLLSSLLYSTIQISHGLDIWLAYQQSFQKFLNMLMLSFLCHCDITRPDAAEIKKTTSCLLRENYPCGTSCFREIVTIPPRPPQYLPHAPSHNTSQPPCNTYLTRNRTTPLRAIRPQRKTVVCTCTRTLLRLRPLVVVMNFRRIRTVTNLNVNQFT